MKVVQALEGSVVAAIAEPAGREFLVKLKLDSELEGIVLVLDPSDFCAEKRARSFGNHFVPLL
jgi:hypothetical protein